MIDGLYIILGILVIGSATGMVIAYKIYTRSIFKSMKKRLADEIKSAKKQPVDPVDQNYKNGFVNGIAYAEQLLKEYYLDAIS